jgi:hypothetical protein
MKPIVIKVSQRRIERLVFILLLLFFMSTTVYYSYKSDQTECVTDTTVSSELTNESTKNITSTTSIRTNISSTTATKKTSLTTKSNKTSTTKTTSTTGKVDITIGPLKYEKKTSGIYTKAVIERITFIIKNGLKDNLNMKVKIYLWDSSTPSDSAVRTTPKDTITFPTIKPGSSLAKTYNVDNLNMYNFDLTKTIKLEFVNSNGTIIKTETKYLDIE